MVAYYRDGIKLFLYLSKLGIYMKVSHLMATMLQYVKVYNTRHIPQNMSNHYRLQQLIIYMYLPLIISWALILLASKLYLGLLGVYE